MINDSTIISSYNDRPTLLEWLKKVEEALKNDIATAIKFESTSPNHYVASIEFANGSKIETGVIAFPDTIDQVTITDGELIVNYVSGATDNLGKINAYADVIVVNSETNTTEIGNNVEVGGNLQVNGTITTGGKELTAVVANPEEETTETLSKIKIGNTAYAVGGGGSGDNFLLVNMEYQTQTGNYKFKNITTISEDVKTKLINGDIKVISGTFKYNGNGDTGYFSTSYCGIDNNSLKFYGVNINGSTSKLESFYILYDLNEPINYLFLEFEQYALTQG